MNAKPPSNSVEVRSRAEWREWLEANHLRTDGIWLVTYKKAGGPSHLPYFEAVEEALCFGWIDSLPRKLDEVRTMLWFAPRKAGSGWSRVNKERIARMRAAGRMHPAGEARIEDAMADGSWEKLDVVETLTVPSDLEAAFREWPGSTENFAAFPRSARRGILEWIAQAKRPETRAARVRQTAELAARNERANQWRPK